MNSLSEVQMFHNAEILKNVFSHQFLQCFVNVTLFRTRTEIIDQMLWNAKKNLRNLIENLSKINQETSFLRAPNPIAFLTRFRDHFGTILEPFWEVLGSICLHFGCPGASGGASWGSARPSWGLLGRFRTSKPQF